MLHTLLVVGLGFGMAADTVYRGDMEELRVRPPRLEAPDIRADGRLDEAAWADAAVLAGFSQYAPAEGIPATQDTEVRVLYGPDAIYFGVTAHDTDPAGIRAALRERDQEITDDDWVRISLDTFNDDSRAYVFYTNPRGVQADGLWVEGSSGGRGGFGPPIDFAPDFLWDSGARVTDDGWVAEFQIPFVSLRFQSDAEQTWGLNIAREVRRLEYASSWAPLTGNAPNELAQSGRLIGLTGLEPRRLVELNPVATGKRTGEADEGGDLVRSDFQPGLGLNARYGVTRNLVLDATINPDFSQVEADAGQVVVNERFALSFPEKRPFFLEGTEVFNTPQRLVYTRAIADPSGGAKLTGKVGDFDVGYLGAVDESPISFEGGDEEAVFNLFRLRHDLGAGSTVGALYTDRTLLGGSGHNRVGALDTRLFLGRYTVTAQLAGAWTREQRRDDSLDDRFGPMLAAGLSRSSRLFSWSVDLEDVHPDFRARSGFIPRVGDTQLDARMDYTFRRPPGSWLEDWAPQLEVETAFDHDDFWSGRRYQEATLEAGLDVSLRGPNGFVLSVTDGYFAFDPEDYVDYALPASAGGAPMAVPDPLEHLLGVNLFGRMRPLPWLSINGGGSFGEVPIYAEATRGTELRLFPTASVQLPAGLFADLTFTYSRIRRSDGGVFSVAQIPRAKLHYQITRALFVRSIVQYNLQRRDALRTPVGEPVVVRGAPSAALDTGQLQYDLLVSYEPSPGTIVYAGWSRVRAGPETYRYGDLDPVAEGLFVKVSYLFRL